MRILSIAPSRISQLKKGQVYVHKTNCKCFRCSGVSWNKGLKGVMPTPWNKGTKGLTKVNSGSFKKGERRSIKTEFKRNAKELSYMGVHSWIRRIYDKAIWCSWCGSCVNIDWANISGEYKEDRKDWIQLCGKCHHKFDKISEKIWATRRKNGTDKWRGVSSL